MGRARCCRHTRRCPRTRARPRPAPSPRGSCSQSEVSRWSRDLMARCDWSPAHVGAGLVEAVLVAASVVLAALVHILAAARGHPESLIALVSPLLGLRPAVRLLTLGL